MTHRKVTRAARAVAIRSLFVALSFLFVAGVHAQTQTVYDDALQNGWDGSSSYGGGTDFASATIVRSGNFSIAFTGSDSYNAVTFTHAPAVPTATYPVIHFWVNGGGNSGQSIEVFVTNEASVTAAQAPLDTFIAGGSIAANEWREVTIDVTQPPLSFPAASYDRIDLQAGSGIAQPVVYFDDITLMQAGPPPAVNPLAVVPDTQAPVGAEQMLSDVITWSDSSLQQRKATLGHDNTPHFFAGTGTIYGFALREFQYQLSDGSTRTAGVTTYAGNGSHGGFGYVVNHSNANGCIGDDSPLGDFFPYATFTRATDVWVGRHHAIYRFKQNYPRNCPDYARKIPVTIEWVFATGRDNPLYAITYDVDLVFRTSDNAIAPVNTLFDDTRAPYGELNIDGDGFSDIDGVAWGDKFKFTSTTSPVTLNSDWTYNVANTVPYVKEWIAGPLTVDHKKNATMGLVQTQTLAQQDAGARNRYYHDITKNWQKTSATTLACNYAGDPTVYKMPCQNEWAYQANADNLSTAVGGSSNNARLTWGTAYGFLGQDQYDADDDVPDPVTGVKNPGAATYPPGYPKKSYSLFVVLGEHTASPVEAQVTQIEAVQSMTLSAVTGSVVTSGPAGVTRADNVTYDPPGYNHVYGALAFNAAGNQLDANIAVGNGKTLKNPLIIVSNYTAGAPTLKLGGVSLMPDSDFFASPRAAANELWITLNRSLTGATNHLEINTAGGGGCLPAPQNLTATVTAVDAFTNNVSLTWSNVPANSYIVERQDRISQNFAQVGTPVLEAYNENVPAGSAYYYRVYAIAMNCQGDYSTSLLVNASAWQNPNLDAGLVRRIDLVQLRAAASGLHYLAGLPAIATWTTDNTVTVQATKIKAAHVSEIRSVLDEARATLGLAPVVYTTPTLLNQPVNAVDFQEIRDHVQ